MTSEQVSELRRFLDARATVGRDPLVRAVTVMRQLPDRPAMSPPPAVGVGPLVTGIQPDSNAE